MKNIILAALFLSATSHSVAQTDYKEEYRPQIHFSPKQHWMNDPNGMVYYKGIYHLFFQYYPGGIKWGPMHWGHAISKDLIHWQEQPIALYPDSLGYIFSGSAVVDYNNTSGFGKDGKVPLVAIFTHHNNVLADKGSNAFQNQSIAYSLDEGKTWTKYAGNPVLKNPGITDFRDPKVSWLDAEKKWLMTLATKDRISFYSSKNLKDWVKESEFGATIGAHGGVWECPDLFPLTVAGKKVWVLLVNINPGGPNKGSATQYFVGDFDGKTFVPFNNKTKWLDYGPDEYAGITWSNTGNRKIFLGWMSNWLYGEAVPTEKWRSANTIPRELGLQKVGAEYYVTSKPVAELGVIKESVVVKEGVLVKDTVITPNSHLFKGMARIDVSTNKLESFSFVIYNDLDEKVVVGYDKASNSYYIDRSKSGIVNFEKSFAGYYTAPRFSTKASADITLVIDKASVELFADGGLSVMTGIFFPNKPFNKIKIESGKGIVWKRISYSELKGIW
jgi:fructan beta-fructosidase